MSDVSADLGACVQAAKTLLTNIHVLLAKWNITTMLHSVLTAMKLHIPLQTGGSSDKATPWCTFSSLGFYYKCRMSLVLLHTFAQDFIALWYSTSPGSQIPYRICIQLIPAIVVHPSTMHLCALPNYLLSLFVEFLSYIEHSFSLPTEPAMTSCGTRTSSMRKEGDIIAEHPFSCLCDEFKYSVNGSVGLWSCLPNFT